MIVVSVILISANTGKATELARAQLCNIGGTHAHRDYHVATLRGRSSDALDKGVIQRQGALPAGDSVAQTAFKEIEREGEVRGHPSPSVHVWNLVSVALQRLGYGRG